MGAGDIEYMGDYKEFPTKESALDWLDNYLSLDERNNLIRALQEPVLEKIKAEIKEMRSKQNCSCLDCLDILDNHISELKGE